MSVADLLMDELKSTPLRRLGPEQEAGLWIASLPWPRTQAKSLSPVSNAYDRTLESCREYARDYITTGGFEDGALPRGGNPNPKPEDNGRSEAGWEGEAPWALFMLAWLSGDGEDYDNAMRAAWHFTDVAIDHAEKLVRMHGFARHAFAQPMNRVLASIAAYLETGDPYLLESAQAVVDNAHWVQKNSWPRLAVGRDGKYVRSAVMLYRYFADERYRRIAHEGAMMVAASQRPNGSFGDQAGGSGIHQVGSYITKPWMGLMATEGVLDYLELIPGDEALIATVQRFADWLMAERFDHDGVMGWSYQHDFNGKRRYFDAHGGTWWDLPGPGNGMWHQNSLARLLGFCTLRTGDSSYLDAWAESYEANPGASGDHAVATSGHPIPWLQCKLWQPELTDEGVRIRPLHFGPRTEKCARIATPSGPVDVAWDDSGDVSAPDGVTVERGPSFETPRWHGRSGGDYLFNVAPALRGGSSGFEFGVAQDSVRDHAAPQTIGQSHHRAGRVVHHPLSVAGRRAELIGGGAGGYGIFEGYALGVERPDAQRFASAPRQVRADERRPVSGAADGHRPATVCVLRVNYLAPLRALPQLLPDADIRRADHQAPLWTLTASAPDPDGRDRISGGASRREQQRAVGVANQAGF